MTHYTTNKYSIEIYTDQTFADSADNINQYDLIHLEQSDYRPTTILGIKVFQDSLLIKSCAIGSQGGGTGIHATSTLIENDRILVCCSDSIFCLSIPSLTLLWKTQADQATCFEIYHHHDSYIIHGELEISRLDKDGKILWQQSGTDIFTTLDGKDNFEVTENYILATDWEYRTYKFNLDGELIL